MSNQDAERKLLASFFSGYFHEDWMCDATDPAEVIAKYLRDAQVHEVAMLRKAISNFVSQVVKEADLEKKLFSEFGCYYQPHLDGQSVRKWLLNIVSMLQ